MSRYETDPYVNVDSYPIWKEIKDSVEKKDWSEVYKLGKKFTSKVVKTKDLEAHAESAIKSMMNMMNYDNLSAIITSEKPKVIMQILADALNERTDDTRFSWDLKWKLDSRDKENTIVMDFPQYKLKLIPCNNAYPYYNMEDYYNEMDFKIYDDKKLYENRKSAKKSIKESEEIMFGADLIKLLEKKYGMNKVKEYPTKYRDGHTEINFVYAFVEDMDDLTSSDPFIVFTIDDESDAVVWGEMYPTYGEEISLESFKDVENFFKKANLKESKSLKEARYDWKVEPRDEDWSDDTYAYFLVHISLKRMAEYLSKEFKKDWWFKADYGQDYVWIVAEHKNYPVRLFCNFYEGGFADIKRHYFDSSSYTDETLMDWHFSKYDLDYSFGILEDTIENYFKKFEKSKKPVKKSIREAKLDVEKVWETLIKDEPYPDVNGILSLADFEQSDYFFIPTSSFNSFPRKRPSSGTWGCKAKFLNERGNWENCVIHCTLPWKENLDAMGKKWNEITSYMLLVQGVYIDYYGGR